MLNRWQRTIVDLRGNVVPYAQLQILREQTQSSPTIYRDRAGTEVIPNAIVTANQNGYAYFYAPADLYRIRSSQPTIDWRDVDVGSAAAQQLAQQALDNAVPTYETLVDMQADASQTVPTLGRVVNDSVLENNGYYVWTGTAWDRAAYQPLSDMDVSIDPAPGKIPLAGGSGTIKQAWVSDLDFELEALRVAINRLAYGDGPYPTLDLRFSGATMLDPRVEFTRASTATGTGPTGRIFTAAIDEPRFVYEPATGEAQGLLVEGQATNLLLWSEDFDNSIWLQEGVSVSQSSELDPSGGAKAFHIQWSGGSEGDRLQQSVPISENTEYTLSVWAKLPDGVEGGRLNLNLRMTGGDAEEVHTDFELSNEWRRYKATINSGNNTTALARLVRKHGVPSINVLQWGAQLEEGTHPTSYIPTEGSQVTRASDNATIPTGDWFNPNEGTFVVEGEAQPRGTSDGDNIATLLKAGDSIASTDGLVIDRAGGTNHYFARSRASDGALTSNVLGNAPGTVKIALAYTAGGDMRGVLNGGDVVTGPNRWDGTGDFLYIGAGGLAGGGRDLRRANGPISRITYYPRALSDLQLQALTS